MKAKDYRTRLEAVRTELTAEIQHRVQAHGKYDWNGNEDGMYGPVVAFEDDDFTDILSVETIYQCGNNIILHGKLRDTIEYIDVDLKCLCADDLVIVLEYIELY